MAIGGFPTPNTSGSGGGSTINAIENLALTNGNVIGTYTNASNVTFFSLPVNINGVSLSNNTLTFNKSDSSTTDINLPNEVLTWQTLSNILNNKYYSYDNHLWLCTADHTSTSTFDYTKFTLQGNSYTITYNNVSNIILPDIKKSANMIVQLESSPTSITIDYNNLKTGQTVELVLISSSQSSINITFTHATNTLAGDIVGLLGAQLFNNDERRKIILRKTSNTLHTSYIVPRTTLLNTTSSNGTSNAKYVLSPNPPSGTQQYQIYIPTNDISLDSVPQTNFRSGTPNYSGRSGIVSGQLHNLTGVQWGSVISGNNNAASGTGRVIISGVGAATTQNTPYSYREFTIFSGTTPFYASCSDITLLQKIMSDNTFNYLTLSNGSLKKTLATYADRPSIGVHHITLVGESSTDMYMVKLTVVYKYYNSVYTILSNVVTETFNTAGAAGWTYDVSDVTDNTLKIIPTGGDYWFARVNSIYNSR